MTHLYIIVQTYQGKIGARPQEAHGHNLFASYWADFCSSTNLIGTYSGLDTIFILMLLSFTTAKLETNPFELFTLRCYSTYNSLWLQRKYSVGASRQMKCYMSVSNTELQYFHSVSVVWAPGHKWEMGVRLLPCRGFGSPTQQSFVFLSQLLSSLSKMTWPVSFCLFKFYNLTFKTIQ